jgi:hypothetical protein
MLQFVERLLQGLLAVGGKTEGVQQLGHVRRDITFMAQQADNLIFH